MLRGVPTAVCQAPRYTFERVAKLKSEIQPLGSAPLFAAPIFLKRDFTSVKGIRGEFFWPKLSTNGLS
jgi:hypothetical protein